MVDFEQDLRICYNENNYILKESNMAKNNVKTYLMIPLALTLFMAASKVSADETAQTASASDKLASSEVAAATSTETSVSKASTSQNTAAVSRQSTSQKEPSQPVDQTAAAELTTAESSQQRKETTTAATSPSVSSQKTVQTQSQPTTKAASIQNQQSSSSQSFKQAAPLKRLAVTKTPQSSVATVQKTPKEVTAAAVEAKGIKLQYKQPIAKGSKIQFAVWTAQKGQDDLKWYTANNMGAAYAEFKNHREYGTYYIHTYANQKGKMTGLNAMTVRVAKPQIKTKIQKASANHFEITVANVPNTITQVDIPVWSDKKGQDDLKWYRAAKTANGSYKITVNLQNHKNTLGHYQAHIYGYSTVTQSQIGLGVSSGFDNVDSRSNATASVVGYKETSGTFNVVVKGSPSTKVIKSVSVAVWSEENGQDDLKWYTPAVINNQATAKINIANHANVSGLYHVHVYTDYTDGTKSGKILGTYKITKAAAEAKLTSKGISLKLTAANIKDKTKVSFAVWSNEKGQDDLKWYQADKQGEAIASYDNHKGYGLYNIHVYHSQNRRLTGLGTATINIPKPSVTTSIAKTADNEYTVILKNVPYYISSVQVPVWTSKNNQDDIKWYGARKISDKTYEAKVLLKNHQFETGRYNAHVYGKSRLENNKLIGMGGKEFTVSAAKISSPKVSVTNHQAKKGTLDVVVTETSNSKKLKSVKVAAWSEAKQSNLYWYTSSTVKDGKISITVNEKNHGYIKGSYYVHVYVTYQDNQETGFDKGTYRLEAEKPAVALPSYFIDISSHNGTISVAEFKSLKQQGIQGVVVKLTEGTSYINPYAKSQIANAKAAGIKVSAYHYSHYTSAAGAQAEARYFVSAAKAHGLASATVMVNDMEESSMLSNINANVQAWQDEMKRQGYSNLVHYTMASWLDIRGGSVKTAQFGLNNFWIAHYAKGYTYMTQEEAKSFNYYANAAAWQYTSVSPKLSHPLDENIDYTGRFTRQS